MATTESRKPKQTVNTQQQRTTASEKNVKKRSKDAKKNKLIIIISAVLAVAIVAAIVIPKIAGNKKNASTKITTYNIKSISYGDVSQTISGSGTLTPITKETITTTTGGEVTTLNYTVGDEVEEGETIAVIGDETITAPFDGVLLELPIAEGDTLSAGAQLAMLMGKDGFTMGIAVDETEISSVKLDQDVTFTVDAVSGTYTGRVSNISYNGSSSGGSVAFSITATVDYIEGVYPGMSCSAKIVIEDSGEGLLVPVDAVKTSGDNNYVYLAPEGAEAGDEYAEDKLEITKLTKVNVETGMSDGSYIIIESDELSEGDLIVVTTVTSTATGSDSNNSSFGGRDGFGGMGGFGGKNGGMDFGDFDFENFDPSSMPSGGPSFGNFGG